MKSPKLDRWLTVGTNLSVLIGIALLIVEINQNNELVRIQVVGATEFYGRNRAHYNWGGMTHLYNAAAITRLRDFDISRDSFASHRSRSIYLA